MILRTSSDVFIFNLGLRSEGLFWERYILKGQIVFERHWRLQSWTLVGSPGSLTSTSLLLKFDTIKRVSLEWKFYFSVKMWWNQLKLQKSNPCNVFVITNGCQSVFQTLADSYIRNWNLWGDASAVYREWWALHLMELRRSEYSW